LIFHRLWFIIILLFISCEEGVNPGLPEISISSPLNNATVAGVTPISVLIADDNGIASVEFFLDGNLLETLHNEPYTANWNTLDYENGEHSLQCRAIDIDGNETLSNQIIVRVANALFTAKFVNNWLCDDCGTGVLFVQDLSGNLLGQASWDGNATVVIEDVNQSLSDSGRISVTTMRGDGYGNVNIATYLDLPRGEIWTFRGLPRVDLNFFQTIDFNIGSVPAHSGWSVSNAYAELWGFDTQIPAELSLKTYKAESGVYLRLSNTTNGTAYLWYDGLAPQSYDISLSNLLATTEHSVQFPSDAQEARTLLYGYTAAGDYSHGSFLLDRVRFDPNTTTMRVHSPQSEMQDYRTYMYYFKNGGWNYNTVYGDIPRQFGSIDASMTFVSGSKNNFEITTTGTFDQIRSYWRYRSGETVYTWNIVGRNDLTNYRVPDFPSLVAQFFPNMARSQFVLSKVELLDYPELTSNEEIWDIRFKWAGYFNQHISESRTRSKDYVAPTP
jgi:hypothetical protein